MPRYRLFTNDRGRKHGTPLYSCLFEIEAADKDEALTKVPKQFGPPVFAPPVAIEWPPNPTAKRWLAAFVEVKDD